jgi:hypothetical protein
MQQPDVLTALRFSNNETYCNKLTSVCIDQQSVLSTLPLRRVSAKAGTFGFVTMNFQGQKLDLLWLSSRSRILTLWCFIEI